MKTQYKYQRYTLQLKQEDTAVSTTEYFLHSNEASSHFFREVCQLHLQASEEFIVAAINAKGNVIGWSKIAVGEVNMVTVHPREVFKFAIAANAVAIVAGHNHVSGDITPSKEDITTSTRLKDCGEMLQIPLLDHIILGPEEHYSFKKQGLL